MLYALNRDSDRTSVLIKERRDREKGTWKAVTGTSLDVLNTNPKLRSRPPSLFQPEYPSDSCSE